MNFLNSVSYIKCDQYFFLFETNFVLMSLWSIKLLLLLIKIIIITFFRWSTCETSFSRELTNEMEETSGSSLRSAAFTDVKKR